MWYVVCDEYAGDSAKRSPLARIWTLSRTKDTPGWETDNGYNGYGLTKADAEELAYAANKVNGDIHR